MGLVETKEGHVGGYAAVSGTEKATLLTIADGLGISFVDTKWRSGTEDMDCFISSGMSLVFDRLYEEMDRACREELKHITLESIAQEVVERQRARMENAMASAVMIALRGIDMNETVPDPDPRQSN